MIGASRPSSGSAIAKRDHLAVQQIVVLPVHEHARTPAADQMVRGGEQYGLTDGRSGKYQDRKRQQRANQDGQPRCLPVVGVNDRSGPGKFGPQRRIQDAPIRADIAFEQFLRLIDRFDDIIVDAPYIGARNEVAQDHRLADRARHRPFKIMPGARPAELADDNLLARIRRQQSVVESQGLLDREFLWHAFPIGNDMGEDLVHGVDEFRMVDEGLPMIRGRHRNWTVSLHTPDNLDELGRGVFMPEQGLIAHDQPSDVGVAPGELERGRDLTLVSGVVLVDPDAKRDLEPELSRDLRDTFQTLGRSVRTHRPCVSGDHREVGADLRFGYPQSIRRRFGKPVVGDARQLAFDRSAVVFGFFSAQRPR